MGLFENLGRKVGELSHQAREATREQAVARCVGCETLVYSERDTCPECGGEELVPHGDVGAEGSDDAASAGAGDAGSPPDDEQEDVDVDTEASDGEDAAAGAAEETS